MLNKLNPFRGYFRYLIIFRRYLGNKIFFLFALSLVAVAADSVGIIMLLPLLKLSSLSDGFLSGKGEILLHTLETIGLPKSQIGILLFIGLVFAFKGGIKFVQGAYSGRLRTRMGLVLKSKLLHHYTQMEYLFYISKNTGHFINVINAQIDRFLKSFNSLIGFSAEVITVACYLLFAFFLNWPFTLMAIVGGGIVLVLFRFLSEFSKKISHRVSIENGTLQKLLIQMLHALKYLASTSSTNTLERNAVQSLGRLTFYSFRLSVAGAFTRAVGEPIAVFFLVLLLIIQINLFQQPFGPIFISLLLFNRAMNTIISIQGSWQALMSTVGGVEMVLDEFNQVQKYKEFSGNQKIEKFRKGITFKDVSFAYDRRLVLKNINLSIPINSTIAIVGESGAGKSTLVDLITLLLKPKSGRILIDGIPHADIDYSDWRKNIGFVTQETVVFDDTLANNISLWTCDYTKDKICRVRIEGAAKQAYCTSFVNELQHGFETIVGDRGVKLSGGQRQRLFIARELFRDPRLLILDEATSSLDTESERCIQKSIDELKGQMTVVIIAHRLSTVRNVDMIYVLDKGQIVEQGHFDELADSETTRLGKMVAMQNLR